MSRQSAALSSATQHAMPPEFGGKWEIEYLITRFPLPTLLCAGYSVKLIFFLNRKQSLNLIRIYIFVRHHLDTVTYQIGSTRLDIGTRLQVGEAERLSRCQSCEQT